MISNNSNKNRYILSKCVWNVHGPQATWDMWPQLRDDDTLFLKTDIFCFYAIDLPQPILGFSPSLPKEPIGEHLQRDAQSKRIILHKDSS